MSAAVTWHGGYWEPGRFTPAPGFASEADATAWAAETSKVKPWVNVGIGEDVRQLSGGNYARPKKCHGFKGGVLVSTHFVSAVCG